MRVPTWVTRADGQIIDATVEMTWKSQQHVVFHDYRDLDGTPITIGVGDRCATPSISGRDTR